MKFITERELAKFLSNEYGLPTSKKSLEKLRAKGKAPNFRVWGGKIVYEKQDIQTWLNNQMAICYKYTMPKYSI